MASVKVAVRIRPFNQREIDMGAKLIIQMNDKTTGILNCKANIRDESIRYKEFTYDYSYWSHDENSDNYASQEKVYCDLGAEVVDCAFEGYNACVFAYGQTGSGKTYTMMGPLDDQGLIPRICKVLFERMSENSKRGITHKVQVSYLEIYQERVADLLRVGENVSLKVREHPKKGPYVQGLTTCLVTNYGHIQDCINRGNSHRTTAATNMNDVSSRSHAIFTITFVQAGYCNGVPSETVSKIHLVDLAGSERADTTGATGERLKEGAHINKSLVTLGSVISTLADSSEHQNNNNRKLVFIPYRDSVLTWLLKDSLGGNSKTIMLAAISPADCNYGETLSTLRYANRAKNIINKPTVNEDPNVKLIRELREEISKLRALMFCEQRSDMLAQLHQKEAREKELTEEWAGKWREAQAILREQKALGLRKSGPGVVLDSDRPHLVAIDDDPLTTGVTLYHLKEGVTTIGTEESTVEQDIVLKGAGVEPQHCTVSLHNGIVTLHPQPGAYVMLNNQLIEVSTKLSQGCIIFLGRTHVFRFNDPAEAAELRKGDKTYNLCRLNHLLSWSTPDLAVSMENLHKSYCSSPEDEKILIENQKMNLQREKQKLERDQEEFEKRQEAFEIHRRNLQEMKIISENNNTMKECSNTTSLLKCDHANEVLKLIRDSDMQTNCDINKTVLAMALGTPSESQSSDPKLRASIEVNTKYNSDALKINQDQADNINIENVKVENQFSSDSGVELKCPSLRIQDESDITDNEDCKGAVSDSQSTTSSSTENKTPVSRCALRMKDIETLRKFSNNIAKQKELIITKLENNCPKEEIDMQVNTLQELQQKYVLAQRRSTTFPTLIHPLQSDEMSDRNLFLHADDMLYRQSSPLHLHHDPWFNRRQSFYRSLSSIHCNNETIVCIPRFYLRGTGSKTHYEYEIRICTIDERWSIMRRYSRFRDLHLAMKAKYKDKVSSIPFPSKVLFANKESVAQTRKHRLELYLLALIENCRSHPLCPLSYSNVITKTNLIAFSPFFQKGVFENSIYGTS